MVPFRGYVIIRFQTDNPGFWLMHCHLEAHMDIGMAVVLQVGEISEQPKPPKDFPKCSNFKRESLYKSESKEHFNGFLQLPEIEKTTTKGNTTKDSTNTDSDTYEMSSTSYVTIIVFLVAFFVGVAVFGTLLLIRHCRWHRGYDQMNENDRMRILNKN